MNPITLRIIAVQILILLGFALGAINWYLQPDNAVVWLLGMLTLPVSWALIAAFGATSGLSDPGRFKTIYNSLIVAGILITGSLTTVLAEAFESIPQDWPTRYGMLMSALILIVIGNGLPKQIESGQGSCSTSRSQIVQRLLGWTFVITGLLSCIIWLTLPIEFAKLAGLTLYAGAIVFAALKIRSVLRTGTPMVS